MRILCIGAGAMKRVGILRLRPWSAFADPLASLGRGRMRPPLHRLCLHIEKPRHSGSGWADRDSFGYTSGQALRLRMCVRFAHPHGPLRM